MADLPARVPSRGDTSLSGSSLAPSGGPSPDPSWLPPSLPPRSGPPREGSTFCSLCTTHGVPRDPQVASQPGSWMAESLAAHTSSVLASGKLRWRLLFSRLGRGDVWPAECGASSPLHRPVLPILPASPRARTLPSGLPTRPVGHGC